MLGESATSAPELLRLATDSFKLCSRCEITVRALHCSWRWATNSDSRNRGIIILTPIRLTPGCDAVARNLRRENQSPLCTPWLTGTGQGFEEEHGPRSAALGCCQSLFSNCFGFYWRWIALVSILSFTICTSSAMADSGANMSASRPLLAHYFCGCAVQVWGCKAPAEAVLVTS